MRIAIVGAGSLGTALGAYLTKAGRDVVLVDTFKDHVDALNEKGATITGTDELQIKVKAILPEEMEGIYDVVFYLAKAPANKVALTHLLDFIDENSVVCTLQNGLPEGDVAAIVGADRTVGGTVGWGAVLQGPGATKLTTTKEAIRTGAFEIGEVDGSRTPRIEMVKEILDDMGHTTILDNFTGMRWAKLFINATYSGLSAALGVKYGDILDDPELFNLSLYVGNEVIKAARLNGVYIIDDFQGHDIKEAEFDDAAGKEKAAPMYKEIFGVHYEVTASMLNDMRRGIFQTEIQQINGSVVRSGEKVGYPTPFNAKIVELVERAQATKTVPEVSNFAEFKELLENAPY